MRSVKPILAVACGLAGIGILSAGALAGAPGTGVPASARALLRGQALRVAAAEGERHPYDIQAVRTTAGEADRITCGPRCHTNASASRTPVYLLAMRGRFSCNTCSPPHGERIGPGTVITLEIPIRASLRYTGFRFGDTYPNLRAAGTPARL